MNKLSQGCECKLESEVPGDCISRVRFAPKADDLLLSSSWDGHVRVHNVRNDTLATKFKLDDQSTAVLDAAWLDNSHICAGGLGQTVVLHDLESNQSSEMGEHKDAVRCIEYGADHSVFLSGGWDAELKLHDWRSRRSVGSFAQDFSIYSMSVVDDYVVVAQKNRKVHVWDLRSMQAALYKRESSLKCQTRFVECFPERQGYVLSSIEGRVAVEYFDPSPDVQRNKYAFKCHRTKGDDGMEEVYPVNAISFNKQYGTFASGGSDCQVNIWDSKNKKRLCQFRDYPTSVSSLSFSDSGRHLAIATSYLYEMADSNPDDLTTANHPADAIFLRSVTVQETKPK